MTENKKTEDNSIAKSGLLGIGVLFLILSIIFLFMHITCFIILIIIAIVCIFAGLMITNRNVNEEILDELKKTSKPSNNSVEILKTRYAKGEINKEEFEQMKKDIEE